MSLSLGISPIFYQRLILITIECIGAAEEPIAIFAFEMRMDDVGRLPYHTKGCLVSGYDPQNIFENSNLSSYLNPL